MDRFKCPLHGKIVKRNEIGEIVNEIDRKDTNEQNIEIQPWLDTDLINDINAANGKTIIETGKKKSNVRASLKEI